MFRGRIYRKALFRQPIHLLILLILLIAACFVFTFHAAEALLVARETNALEQYYRPIGYLSGKKDKRAGQEMIAECPYLELENIFYYGLGVLEDHQNPDLDGGEPNNKETSVRDVISYHTEEVLFVGRYTGSDYITSVFDLNKKDEGYYSLRFEVCSVESSYTNYLAEGQEVFICQIPGLRELGVILKYYPAEQKEDFMEEYEGLVEGETYLMRAFYYEFAGMNPLGGASEGYATRNFILEYLLPEGIEGKQGIYFYPVSGAVDYSNPDLAGLPEYLEYLEYNRHVMQLIGIKEMGLIPDFQEEARRYYLSEGRFLTEKDEQEKNPVCVVHEEYAKLRGLQVGDKIRLNIKDKEQGGIRPALIYNKYPYWEDWALWKNCNSQELELEIVGLYHVYARDGYSSYVSEQGIELYVPDSILPEGYGKDNLEQNGGYSFVLKKPGDKKRFEQEYGMKLEEAGYTVLFLENNAENFAETAKELRQSTVFGTILFGSVLLVVLLAVIGLYLVQRRKEYAITRALGVPSGGSITGAAVAFAWVAVPGVLIGCYLGWQQMKQQAGELLLTLQEEGKEAMLEAASLPVWYLPLIMVVILLIIVLLLGIGSLLFLKKPVLSLLQGGSRTSVYGKSGRSIKKEGKETRQSGSRKPEMEAIGAVQKGTNGFLAAAPIGGNGRVLARLRYIRKHLWRTKAKTLLPLLLGAGVVLLFGWMSETMTGYEREVDRLYHTTTIKGEILATSTILISGSGGGFIEGLMVSRVEKNDLVQEVYREDTTQAEEIVAESNETGERSVLQNVPLLGLYEWEKFTERWEGVKVSFFAGYSWLYLLPEASVYPKRVLLSEKQMETLGVTGNDMIQIKQGSDKIDCVVVGFYQMDSQTAMQFGDDRVIMQADALHELAGSAYCRVAEFTFDPTKNRELLDRQEELENLISGGRKDSSLRLFIRDGELRQVVEPLEETLSLFRSLYPVAMVVVLILGLGFQFLLILQRRREAAVMRILGNTAWTVKGLFGTEQLLLCFVGTAFGLLLGFLRYQTWEEKIWFAIGLYLLGNLMGIIAGSITVTKRSPLALLQEKE